MRGMIISFVLLTATFVVGTAVAQDGFATLRGGTPLAETANPPRIATVSNTDRRQVRNYPEQPPVIPHKIDNSQIHLRATMCLTCHSRTAVEVSQAPMVSSPIS